MILEEINDKFNYDLWRYIKIYAFSVESFNLARIYCGTGIEVDKSIAKEEVKTELYLNDEVLFQKIIRPFCPKGVQITIGEFFQTLNLQNSLNLYSLISENLLIEIISIFEDYLQNLLKCLLSNKPELVLSKDKNIKASDLLDYNNLEELLDFLVDEKVQQTMYKKSIIKIINYLSSAFQVKLDFDYAVYQNLHYWKEVRNILIHNQGLINEKFVGSIKKFGIEKEFSIGERIKFNIYDIVDLTVEIKDVANTIYTKITGKAPKELENDPLQIPSDTQLQNTILHKTRKKTGRNEPCPCGSGLKYKKCCSKIDPRTGERV